MSRREPSVYIEDKIDQLEAWGRPYYFAENGDGGWLLSYRTDRETASLNHHFADETGQHLWVCAHMAQAFHHDSSADGQHAYHRLFSQTRSDDAPQVEFEATNGTIGSRPSLKHPHYSVATHTEGGYDYRADCYTQFQFKGTGLGKQLYRVNREMSEQDQTDRQCTLYSDNHAMAVAVRRKVLYDGTLNVVKFYDPNESRNHHRIVTNNPEMLKHVSIDWLLTKEIQRHYFPEQITALLAEYDDIHHIKPHNPQSIIKTSDATTVELATELLFDSLKYNKPRSVKRALNYLLSTLNQKEDHLALARLLMTHTRNNVHLHEVALENNSHEALGEFISKIASSRLQRAYKIALIENRNRDGNIVAKTMRYNNARAVKALITFILDSGLSEYDAQEIIKADGALLDAVDGGDTNIARAYVETVLKSKELSTTSKFSILSMQYLKQSWRIYNTMTVSDMDRGNSLQKIFKGCHYECMYESIIAKAKAGVKAVRSHRDRLFHTARKPQAKSKQIHIDNTSEFPPLGS